MIRWHIRPAADDVNDDNDDDDDDDDDDGGGSTGGSSDDDDDGKIRPHRRCKGRDHPDGISQLRFRFTWGRGFGKNLLFLIGRDAGLQKTL